MEVKVHLFRPERRFGFGVIVHRTNFDGVREIMRINEDGTDRWEAHTQANIEVSPTLFIGDEVMLPLIDAYFSIVPRPAPAETREDVLQAHLSRESFAHDRAMMLVDRLISLPDRKVEHSWR